MPHTQMHFGKYYLKTLFWFILGGFLAALGIDVFLVPNKLVDGGIVGLAIMGSTLFGKKYLPYFLILFNLPFVFVAYRFIGKHFVIQMFTAVVSFAIWLALFYWVPIWLAIPPIEFHGESIEVIVLGGFIIGCGSGLIIRYGGSTDGTEILGIIINRKRGVYSRPGDPLCEHLCFCFSRDCL